MLPQGVKHLLIINVLMFVATFALVRFIPYSTITMDGQDYLISPIDLLSLWPVTSGLFRIWQPFTYMFMHAGFGHIFFNMFALWMFGYVLENYWGTKRFVIYYLICGLGAAATHIAMSLIFKLPTAPTVGASGAVYGILLAFGMMFPNERIYLYFLMPIKAKWFVIGYAVIELYEGFFRADNVAHFAHLGGMLFGLILILLWRHSNRNDNPYQMY